MSLILDALNRAENERKNQNDVPDLSTLHRPMEVEASADVNRTLWWGVGVVLVLIAIIIVLVVMLRSEPAAPISKMEIAPAPQSPVIQTPPAPIVEQAREPEPILAEPTAAPPVGAIAQQGVVPSADINKLYAAEESEASAVVDTGVNELYAAEAAITAASETIVDPFNPLGGSALTSVTGQEQAPPRTFDSINNIPDFNALPWNMRQKIPTISYARHNYLANGISSVVINNQTTGVGNIIGTGQFVVQEIYVDGVVLKHGNTVFKLRALNGWINM
jgi:general secretion pathway protein B